MAIDPEVQQRLDEISNKIEQVAKDMKTGEFVIPLGNLGLSEVQADDVKKAAVAAVKAKLTQFGIAAPVVAGTYSYSR